MPTGNFAKKKVSKRGDLCKRCREQMHVTEQCTKQESRERKCDLLRFLNVLHAKISSEREREKCRQLSQCNVARAWFAKSKRYQNNLKKKVS